MFHLDLKRASIALAASRLDDAFEVLTTSPERTHRDAQQMISELAGRFIERAQQHLAANRLQDAEHDAERALQLAGGRTDVAEILDRIRSEITIANTRRQSREQILKEVRQQAEAGRFSLGQRLLQQLSADELSRRGVGVAKEAEHLLNHRRQVIEHVVRQISDAAESESADAVVARLKRLSDAQQDHPEVHRLKDTAVRSICNDATQAIVDGRIDKAISALESVQCWKHSAIEELTKLLSCCSAVNMAISRNDFPAAETHLRLLSQLASAKWISAALKQIQAIAEQQKELQSGPLGLLTQFDRTVIEAQPTPGNRSSKIKSPLVSGTGTPNSGRILQVDGIGSLLLQTQDVVSIGTLSQTRSVDVGLQTGGRTEPVVIRRTSEDYFAESTLPFIVNGKETHRHLLRDADSIEIGERGRLKFLKPVAASSSAVLVISGAKLQRRDVRSIVLLADSVLFGATGCHFKLPGITTPVLLHRSGNEFAVRELGQESQILQPGMSTSVQHVRFALADIEIAS